MRGLTGTITGHRPDGSSFRVQVSVSESRIAGRVLYCCFIRAVE